MSAIDFTIDAAVCTAIGFVAFYIVPSLPLWGVLF